MQSRTLTPILLAAVLSGAVAFRLAQHSINFSLEPKVWLGLVPLVVLGVYWTITSNQRATDQQPEKMWSSIVHKTLVAVSQGLMIFPIPGLLGQVIPDSPVIIAVGCAVEVTGLAVAIAARRRLGRNWSAEVRIAHDHALVREGVYAHLRHPIYTGLLCMYVGFVLISGSLHAVLGFGLVCLAYARKIILEERILSQAFGPDFDDYRQHSRAVIPGIL